MSDDYYSIRRIFDESVLEHRAKVEAFIEQYIVDSLPTSSYSQYSKNRVETMLRDLSDRIMEITRESIHKMQIKASKKMGSTVSEAQSDTLSRINELEEQITEARARNRKCSSEVQTLQARIQEKDQQINGYIKQFKEVENLLQVMEDQGYENRIANLEAKLSQTQEHYNALQEKYQNEKEQWELKFVSLAREIDLLKAEEGEQKETSNSES